MIVQLTAANLTVIESAMNLSTEVFLVKKDQIDSIEFTWLTKKNVQEKREPND